MSRLAFIAALASVAVGCGDRGVSLGSEEACGLDPKLAAAQASTGTEWLPACATIGPNQLVNFGLESPVISTVSNCPRNFCQVGAIRVSGWRTTGEDQVIEVWRDEYLGVPAPEGTQFVELDAESPDTLYQDVVLTPGELVYWSVLHRGRLGSESIEVLLGPPEGPVSQGLFESSDQGWEEHSGIYAVGADETVTRFSLASRSGLTEGNLIDRAELAPIEVAE